MLLILTVKVYIKRYSPKKNNKSSVFKLSDGRQIMIFNGTRGNINDVLAVTVCFL